MIRSSRSQFGLLCLMLSLRSVLLEQVQPFSSERGARFQQPGAFNDAAALNLKQPWSQSAEQETWPPQPLPAQQQDQDQQPWPAQAPPFPDDGVPFGFETVLPADIIQQLRDLHDNPQLTFPEKRAEFDRILNSVPGDILAKLPFPPGFIGLPDEVKEKIQAIHANPSLTWNEKNKQIGDIIEGLPVGQRQFLPLAPPGFPPGKRPNFPPTPPPGFENVLPPQVYSHLLQIHQDPSMTPKEKIHKIDEVMRGLDQRILDALPLPPGFDQLPAKVVEQARAIFSDKTLDYEAKNKKIILFVKSLPEEQRKLVKPPLPPVLNVLPPEVTEKIENIFDDENLDEEQRHTEFWKLVDTLSPTDRARIHAELGDGEEQESGPSNNPNSNDAKSDDNSVEKSIQPNSSPSPASPTP